MVKKPPRPPPPPPETPKWDPESKEIWHFEFEKEPVNDEKWSCIVTAAVQSEAQEDEYLQIYKQCVSTGLRKAVKVIAMPDVAKLLKERISAGNTVKKEDKKRKGEKPGKPEKVQEPVKSDIRPVNAPFSQILDLASKFASFTDTECRLPSDLMAAVLKYLILNLKNENCLEKRIKAVRNRKTRERKLKEKFIRNQKPYAVRQEEGKTLVGTAPRNVLEIDEPISDEPVGGPDLYIMLMDFYDVTLCSELLKMNVPFRAFLKISPVNGLDMSSQSVVLKGDALARKKSEISYFWDKLKEECFAVEKAPGLKDIAILQCVTSCKPTEPKQHNYRLIFDELTWMQYSAYSIHRQYQKYLQELQVQRLILSLEPLDLSKCELYNKLCDALITGQSLTPLLILYAIVEQVVAGVPETESVPLEYEPIVDDSYSKESVSNVVEVEKQMDSKLVTPCQECRNKKYELICDDLEQRKSELSDVEYFDRGEWIEIDENSLKSAKISLDTKISESFIDRVVSEKKTEKELREEKKWRTPELCVYGDEVFIQSYHCDPRLLDPETLVERFLKKSDHFRFWTKYPELPPGEKVFYNYHFHSLKNISKETEDQLQLMIFFTTSMKLIGITKSYLYRGDEENTSERILGPKEKLSRVKFNKNAFGPKKTDDRNFDRFFLKTFIGDVATNRIEKKEFVVNSGGKTDPSIPHKVKSQFSMFLASHRSSGSCLYNVKHPHNDDVLATLFSLLDCSEISNLNEPHFVNVNMDFLNLIQDFKFYEKLEPRLMIQRLMEAQESFNAIQCSYFPPTDTALVITYNEFDHRGISCITWYGALPTPVNFRDFYNYVFPEITDWLVDENAEYLKFTEEVEEKIKAEEEKKDLEYLARLKQKYCNMTEERKKEFLEEDTESEPEVDENDLNDLPNKPKPNPSNKLSFVATNLTDVRVETNKTIHEFHSPDGTEVNVSVGTWLYAKSGLLKIGIKRSKLYLHYHQWLNQELNTSFTFKTLSDIIFSFYKDNPEINYHVTISWPSGLLIKPVHSGSSIYVRQTYLKTYRRGWLIEEEKSRCFLKNGQVVVFKENGSCEVLFASGTRHTYHESANRYEVVSTTGKVWEARMKGPCRNRKKVISTTKILIGVDHNTQETYYRREDGLSCMLWPNGKLVTVYPDGTKITSNPYFDDNEVTLEWTDEEKNYFAELETKYKSEHSVLEPKSRTILRNSLFLGTSKSTERQSFNVGGFVSVSCTYLMEHPKYASVYFNPYEPYVKMSMPENFKILVFPEGNYEIHQDANSLTVYDATVEFYATCLGCEERTSVTLNLDSNEVLCKCVDFFQKSFTVYRNGETSFRERHPGASEDELVRMSKDLEKSNNSFQNCVNNHHKNLALTQRCFAFERDFSGIEFLHSDCLAFYCYELPDETYFDVDADNLATTFSSPYYKVGYEKWVMDYEDKDNSLPTTLKKKDLYELGAKQPLRNQFKYPFPQHYTCGDPQQNEKPKRSVKMPKLIVSRTVRCLSQEPHLVIDKLHKYVAAYQKKARDVMTAYKSHKATDNRSDDSRYVEMRLRKIALTLNQSLHMYPHLCTQSPSTEKEIHYFGHFINSMEGLKNGVQSQPDDLPQCKQIPNPLPRKSKFPLIYEESESPYNT